MTETESRKGELMLISNSTNFGGKYLDHCAEAIREFLGEIREVVFVPYALKDHEGYAKTVEKRFERFGVKVRSLAVLGKLDSFTLIENAPAFFVGGGNSFRLLKCLRDIGLLFNLRQRVFEGAKYIGASAGSNLACPTIKTTNDMPIVWPRDLDALDLVPFQINPHYLDYDPKFPHMGETRETRIKEFHEENDTPVIGLREGSWLTIGSGSQGAITLFGKPARIFSKGRDPFDCLPGGVIHPIVDLGFPK
ncbi:MAG: dipeptidase PepE [Candidatus Vogelbacteria bacterium]